MSESSMIDPNRLTYNDTDATYCAASEGRGEGSSYVPDIWHAVEVLPGGPADLAACGAHYDPDKLVTAANFHDQPEMFKCGGCLSRVGSPLSFHRP